jgi:hypothetical protein
LIAQELIGYLINLRHVYAKFIVALQAADLFLIFYGACGGVAGIDRFAKVSVKVSV